jgi:hypothetical protein
MIARPPKTSLHNHTAYFSWKRCARDQDAHNKEFFMAFKNRLVQSAGRLIVGTFLSILLCTLSTPAPVYARDLPDPLPNLDVFIESVKDGNASTLRGVYVPTVMAYSVTQQPTGYPGFVSTIASTTTQFSMASEVGNIGLLAHNYLAGSSFSKIIQGNQIILIYGNGRTEVFLVESVLSFQALDPLDPYSLFKDLETQHTITAEELFNTVYRGEYHVTLQTCLENEGKLSWGRMFIIAKPIGNEFTNIQHDQIPPYQKIHHE